MFECNFTDIPLFNYSSFNLIYYTLKYQIKMDKLRVKAEDRRQLGQGNKLDELPRGLPTHGIHGNI